MLSGGYSCDDCTKNIYIYSVVRCDELCSVVMRGNRILLRN